MSDPTKDIAGLVECIVKPLVEYPDEVVVTSQEEDSGTAYVEIHVNDEDTGKVIGRQGRVIKSIRTLARAAASRMDQHVEVEILD